jgi:endoglucanase Acf2
MRVRFLLLTASIGLSAWTHNTLAQTPTAAKVGQGQIWLAPKVDAPVRPKQAPYRTQDMAQKALPTNTWYSSLMYMQWSDVLHAHPLTFKATEDGLEMGVPSKEVVPIERIKAWEGHPAAGAPKVAVVHPHKNALRISPAEFKPEDARLGAAGDWNIAVDMNRGGDQFRARISHGSPYAYFTVNRGDAIIEVAVHARWNAPTSLSHAELAKWVQYVEIDQQHFAIYAPRGSQWERASENAWRLKLNDGERYFSVAALPDLLESTRQTFAEHAFAFVENTRVNWVYDEVSSQVRTTYTVDTKAMDSGQAKPLLGLYVHQQQALTAPSELLKFRLPSVRGAIRFMVTDSFETRLRFNGLLPMWPKPLATDSTNQISDLLSGDKRRAPAMFTKMGNGTYWTGKMLGGIAQLMNIAEQTGDRVSATELEGLIKKRMETWFSGQSSSYFAHDPQIGSVIGYPEEYFSVSAMNDHHFHYGYWIMAAAHIARRDPAWASQSQWGGMVDLLIRDIATPERGRPDFPFVRNFDVYEGHSWARGNSEFFGHGNDQESSSEAINAWAAIAMYGEFMGNKALRDLGVYLYCTEISSVLNYWYDIQQQVFETAYGKPLASMVFGGGYAYSTWWTEEPRQIQGINLLPITPASTYLAQLPRNKLIDGFAFVENARKAYDNKGQSDGTPADIWQDIFATSTAIADPDWGMQKWKPKGSVELGETRTRTFHWLSLLKEMGRPNLEVTADTIMHGVFDRESDGQRTYVAFNAERKAKKVKFSDGEEMEVESGQLVRKIGKIRSP